MHINYTYAYSFFIMNIEFHIRKFFPEVSRSTRKVEQICSGIQYCQNSG